MEHPSLPQVEQAMKQLMASWQTLQTAGSLTKAKESQLAAEYAALILQKKTLLQGALPPGVKGSAMSPALTLFIEDLSKDEALGVTVEEIGPAIKSGITGTLQQVVSTVMAVKATAILAQASKGLSASDFATFQKWLEKKVQTKIKHRTEGPRAEPYMKAYTKAMAKAGHDLPVPATKSIYEMEADAYSSKPTTKKKKKSGPPQVEAVSTGNQIDVTSFEVFAPLSLPHAFRGRQVVQMTVTAYEALGQFIQDEAKRAKASKAEHLDWAAGHNFLQIALSMAEPDATGEILISDTAHAQLAFRALPEGLQVAALV
jgi:hypothetical protein